MIRSNYPPLYVTALPTVDLFDGMEIYFAAAAGVTWHFRYNAGSASPFKWECVGGAPMVAQNGNARNVSTAAYGNLPTDPMSLSLPASLSGDFDITIQANLAATAQGNANLSYSVGATAAADAWSATAFLEAGFRQFTLPTTWRHTAVAPGAAIAEKAKTSAGVTIQFSNRRLSIVPVRVG